MENLVSIIMPTYNCADFIEESIRSAQAQTMTRWELIVMDDCSTDDTRERVERMGREDARIQYHRLAENSGAAVARTEAMRLAKGNYIAFLDSDDLWMPEKLERQIAFMESNGYRFSCTDYEQIDEQGNPTGRVIRCKPKVNYNGVLLTCPVGNSSVMYDVAALG
jgi:teichuronic acid biosynthesis glycosyltransferase TuaG